MQAHLSWTSDSNSSDKLLTPTPLAPCKKDTWVRGNFSETLSTCLSSIHYWDWTRPHRKFQKNWRVVNEISRGKNCLTGPIISDLCRSTQSLMVLHKSGLKLRAFNSEVNTALINSRYVHSFLPYAQSLCGLSHHKITNKQTEGIET